MMWFFKQKEIMGELRFKYIFFDLGKTLLYFHGNPQKVFNTGKLRLYAALRGEIPSLNRTEFLDDFDRRIGEYYSERDQSNVEHTTYKILQKSLEDFGYMDLSADFLRKALERLYSISEMHWRPAEDTHLTLRKLKQQGYRLGIVSNAGDASNANRLIDQRSLRSYMDFVLISAEIGIRKPAPLIFEVALEKMGASPEETVMVGDTLRADILGAQSLGIAAIWITRQADTPQNAADIPTIIPDATIKRLKELPSLLANWPGE